jgi:hypothetical protein
MSEALGKLLFGKPASIEIYQLLSATEKKNQRGGLGKAFNQGYLDNALAISKVAKILVVIDCDKLLEIGRIYRNGGQLKSTRRLANQPLTVAKDAYKAALCYALVLYEYDKQLADLQQSFDMDFYKLQTIQAECLELLAGSELAQVKFHGALLSELMQQKLNSSKLQIDNVLNPDDITEGSDDERIDDSQHDSRKARIRSGGKAIIKEDVGRRISSFEMAGNELFRLIVGNHLPATRKIKHASDSQDSIASAQLINFQTLGDSKEVRNYFVKTKFKGLAKILLTSLYLQENDLHEHNCGTCQDEQGRRHIVKIDGDQLFFARFTARLHDFDLESVKKIRVVKSNIQTIAEARQCDGFGIHRRIIQLLPNLPTDLATLSEQDSGKTERMGKPLNYQTCYLPYNFIGYGIEDENFKLALQSMATHKEFNAEKYYTILKINLLPNGLLKSIVTSATDNLKDRVQLMNYLNDSRNDLLTEALLIPEFNSYIALQSYGAFQQIVAEIHDFLSLAENQAYLNCNNPTVTCYDAAVTVQFENCLSRAGLNYQEVQAAYNSRQLVDPDPIATVQTNTTSVGLRGFLSTWCCLFAASSADAEMQPLLTTTAKLTHGAS